MTVKFSPAFDEKFKDALLMVETKRDTLAAVRDKPDDKDHVKTVEEYTRMVDYLNGPNVLTGLTDAMYVADRLGDNHLKETFKDLVNQYIMETAPPQRTME